MTAAKTKPYTTPEKRISTSVPSEWYRHRDLYNWGGALRPRGATPSKAFAIKTKHQRPRKIFDWQLQFIELPVGIGRKLVNALKKSTDEWFNVYSRQGSFWRRRGYLVPPIVVQQLRDLNPDLEI